MENRTTVRWSFAAIVVGIALASSGVIALGFLVPERLFDSTVGVAAFFVAGLLMVVCAVLANRYDLRGSLHNAFG